MACIIIVDDETQVRDVLCQILHTAGHTVVEAPDGRVAMSRLPQVQPDLMILDILMPEKEGLEVIMELRQMASPLKIIAISGGGRYMGTEVLAIAQQLGADCVLAKPFNRQALLAAVEDLLGA